LRLRYEIYGSILKLPTIHNQIQEYIANQLREGSELFTIDHCERCGGDPRKHNLFSNWDSVKIEQHERNESLNERFLYDIALLRDDEIVGVIEIRASSPVKSNKREFLTFDKQLTWIEVLAKPEYFLDADPWQISDPFPKHITFNYFPLFTYCDICNEKMRIEREQRDRYQEAKLAKLLASDETLYTLFRDVYRIKTNYHYRDIVYLETPRGAEANQFYYVKLADGRYLDEAFIHLRDAYDAIEDYFNRYSEDEFMIDDPTQEDTDGNPPTCYYEPQYHTNPRDFDERYEFNSRKGKWEVFHGIIRWEDDEDGTGYYRP
jgi:hypothetical protein